MAETLHGSGAATTGASWRGGAGCIQAWRRDGGHGHAPARLRRGVDGHGQVAGTPSATCPATCVSRARMARRRRRALRVTREDGAAAVDEREERVDLLAANGEHPALLPPEQGADEREVVVHAHAGGEQHALHDGVDPHDVLLVQVQQAEGHVEQDAEHGRRKTRRGRADASQLDLGTTLIFTALYNFASGLLFGIPMPVQPMKSNAAVALSSAHLTIPQIMSAGIAVAAILLFLGATELMTCLYRVLPLLVVRGVQLSQGLSFAFTAVKYIRYDQDFSQSSTASTSVQRSLIGLDGLLLAFAALLFILLATGSGDDDDVTNDRAGRRRSCGRVPAALIVFALGLVLCFVRDPSIFGGLSFGPAPLGLVKLTRDDFKIGFWQAAVPQLPLSVLNSVIAVCKLSSDLFPEQAELSPARVSISVGLMNLVGCWFGAMPCCHGAGGLAGQYRFGGRSGASVVFLAIGKLLLGLVFGNSFVTILGKFPIGILGVMLLFSGVELAMASRDMRSKEESFVMLVCAGVSLTGSSSALGFIAGIVLHLLLRLREVDYRELVGRFSSGRRQTATKAGEDGAGGDA